MIEVQAPSAAGFGRRFGALCYDAVLLFALAMAVTAAFLPFTREAILPDTFPIVERLLQLALLAMIVGFYGFSWVRSGQTLGMSAWRIKVETTAGARVSWSLALKRLALAWVTLGVGLLWVLVDRKKLALHDRWTKTRVVTVPPRASYE